MKKAMLVFIAAVLFVSGCGNSKKDGAKSAASYDDLIKPASLAGGTVEIKETMFITQINDINLNWKSYLGKPIKLEGMFRHLSWNGNDSYHVYRRTPGCCGDDGEIGFELSWQKDYEGSQTGPDEHVYPAKDDWVEVQGVLGKYEKSGFPFLYLALSEINVLDKRGLEFVAR